MTPLRGVAVWFDLQVPRSTVWRDDADAGVALAVPQQVAREPVI